MVVKNDFVWQRIGSFTKIRFAVSEHTESCFKNRVLTTSACIVGGGVLSIAYKKECDALPLLNMNLFPINTKVPITG